MIPRPFQDKLSRKKQDNEFAIHIQMDRLVAKEEQNCSRCNDRIESLKMEIQKEKEQLVQVASPENSQQIMPILDNFSKRKQQMYKDRQNQNLVKEKLARFIHQQKEQIKELETKVQSFSLLGFYSHDLQKIVQANAMLRTKLDHLDEQIECSDPFEYEECRGQNLSGIAQKLEKLREENMKLADQITFKESKQMLQKNKLVTSVGKLQYLKKQQDQRRQKLLSLQRHRDQIRQRNELMKRQHENHQGNSSEVLASIQRGKMFALQLDKEIKQFEQAIKNLNKRIESEQNCDEKEQGSILKEMKQLQERDKILERKLKQGKDIQTESEKIMQNEKDAKQQFYKRLQKKEKRRSILQGQINAADIEIDGYQQQLRELEQKKRLCLDRLEEKKILIELTLKDKNKNGIQKYDSLNQNKEKLNTNCLDLHTGREEQKVQRQQSKQLDENKTKEKQKIITSIAFVIAIICTFLLIFKYYH